MRTDLIERAVSMALAENDSPDAEVCVLVTTDERVAELNRLFRGIDAPTDVLTFPSGEAQTLGDVAIALPYAERQAELRGVSLDQELSYLAIHGALHLVGFDDEEESDRLEMVAEMNRIAKLAGLPPDEDWYSMLHGVAEEVSA